MVVTRAQLALAFTMLLLVLIGDSPHAAELQPKTVEAFDRYVAESERLKAQTLHDTAAFLWIDRLPAQKRRTTIDDIRRGDVSIERLETRLAGKKIEAPAGLIHHWVGVAFVPSGTTAAAVRLLRDYDRHGEIYKPVISRTRMLSQSGDTMQAAMRFSFKKVISVAIDAEFASTLNTPAPARAAIDLISTRVAEVEHPGTPDEKEKPVGEGGGYMWRLNNYWRITEGDNGVYLECESISLSRSIPLAFRWLVGPFVTSVPREALESLIRTTRQAIAAEAAR